MANLRVFVSSTCYDLGAIRSQLKTLLESFGFEPVLSEYKDVLFDPRVHTHTSCVDEVMSVDLLILLVGGRFGGKAVPQAISSVDLELVFGESSASGGLKRENLSVTQLEVLKAIEGGIPVFAFVDDRVLHDHATYEKNKSKEIISQLEFASVEKPETARFIFEFVNFLRFRSSNNAVIGFQSFGDLESALRRQFSGLLQRLLSESRRKGEEIRKIANLSDQLEGLKAAILTAVGTDNEKEVARAVVRFRRLIDFLRSFGAAGMSELIARGATWTQLLEFLGIVDVVEMPPDLAKGLPLRFVSSYRPTQFLVRADGRVYTFRMYVSLAAMEDDWHGFMSLPTNTRGVVFGALTEMYPSPIGRLVRLEQLSWAEIVDGASKGATGSKNRAAPEGEPEEDEPEQ